MLLQDAVSAWHLNRVSSLKFAAAAGFGSRVGSRRFATAVLNVVLIHGHFVSRSRSGCT